MEKLKNHYSLADIQAQMLTIPAMNLTVSARNGIRQAGMAQTDALDVVKKLGRGEFYKRAIFTRAWQRMQIIEAGKMYIAVSGTVLCCISSSSVMVIIS